MMAVRPSSVISSPVFASTMTKDGMLDTVYFSSSASFTVRSAYGMASHGISAEYPSKAAWSLSDDAKTISNLMPLAFILLYDLASTGVKRLHGGHQCAEK